MKKKPFTYYNTSDIGYMDEEWINYIPEFIKEEKEEIKSEEHEEKVEEIQPVR